MMRRLVPALGAAAIACAPVPSADMASGSLLRVNAASAGATLDSDWVTFTVVATLTNRTPDTLVTYPCVKRSPYPPAGVLERREGSTWRTLQLGPMCHDVLLFQPPRLAPGQSRTDTVVLVGGRRRNTVPEWIGGAVTGTYRLVYRDVYRTWHPDSMIRSASARLGELLPESLLVSNSFDIAH